MSQPFPESHNAAPPQEHTRLERATNAFLADRRASNRSARTLQFYDDELNGFLAYLEQEGVDDVLGITAGHIRGYLVELAERRSGGGLHAAYRAIKAFLRWYMAEYEPKDWANPVAKVRPP